ncbi:MAG: GNAT family N-acetyltransferase, partial [Treponema sp.]|nr:GNAT family N-acetyltransferase [Treponema sp.]
KLETEAIRTVLNDGFIPIFPCIGWNSAGHPYNISSMLLAKQVAMNLKADKLFFMMLNEEISAEKYFIPDGFSLSESGNIPAMSLEEVETFLEKNVSADSGIKNLLKAAQEACRAGVTRVHILDGNIDGVLPCEIFSGLGSGTMIYTGSYGKVRPMQQTDIPSVLAIMRPNIQSGKLLPRTEEQIAARLEDYIVYELDGGVHACAALHFYDDGQAEIAAVAVDENYAHMGIGPKLMDNLIEQAVQADAASIFIMTTQTADWFERLGFEESDLSTIPEERRKLWDSRRGSKVYRLKR